MRTVLRADQIQLPDNDSTRRTVHSTATSDRGIGTQRPTHGGYSLWELAVLGS